MLQRPTSFSHWAHIYFITKHNVELIFAAFWGHQVSTTSTRCYLHAKHLCWAWCQLKTNTPFLAYHHKCKHVKYVNLSWDVNWRHVRAPLRNHARLIILCDEVYCLGLGYPELSQYFCCNRPHFLPLFHSPTPLRSCIIPNYCYNKGFVFCSFLLYRLHFC